MASLAEQILKGKHRAIARQITGLENNQPEALSVLAELYPHTGQAHLIGITGPPGSGKSTLVNQLVKAYRLRQQTVAVLSIDPTSPFTGGALLGDRIRLTDLAGDPGVFVRSMATRGSLGGLARAAAKATHVFDAAGFDIILVETVGVGQAEVEIAGLAHTVVVLETPGSGDDVQVIKAGVLEIADIFVVNKADQAGADRVAASLSMMLDLGDRRAGKPGRFQGNILAETASPATPGTPEPAWRPPICRTVATTGLGIEAVIAAIEQHFVYLTTTGQRHRQEVHRLTFEIQQALQERLMADLLRRLPSGRIQQILDEVAARQIDPSAAVELLLEQDRVNPVSTDEEEKQQDKSPA